MADQQNPFFQDDDTIEDEIVSNSENKERESTPDVMPNAEGISLDNVAARLLKDNLILTALEFHTELTESGHELARLRDFFSNPANFEKTKLTDLSSPALTLPRTSSCQTFDSLDFARYSDDGDRQENDKVAVLEFELRKAQDTIKSLRASLTKTAETELSTPESQRDQIEDFSAEEPIRQYEKRALNFLVNEYMLNSDYKLSSVTFAEENENQDFEDWDDVGLNMPKPPDLLRLYRDFGQHAMPSSLAEDIGCQVDLDNVVVEAAEAEIEQHQKITDELNGRIGQLEDQLQTLTTENDFLAHQLKEMERKSEVNRAMKTSTPSVSPISTPSKTHGKPPVADRVKTPQSETEGFEKAENEDVVEPSHRTEEDRLESQDEKSLNDSCQDDSDVASQYITTVQTATQDTCLPERKYMTESFLKALERTAFNINQDNRIVAELSQLTDWSGEGLVLMLARCLPHIVPNVLLAKREELIPLILCAGTLHPDPQERDKLLNILFNLIKRPDVEQRQMILTGCVAFAQYVGPQRAEAELLPQCWEQIGHKYAERRLLVAQACGALAPYLMVTIQLDIERMLVQCFMLVQQRRHWTNIKPTKSEMRSSLVLSMLSQILSDDKTEDVREAAVRSLGLLMGYMDAPDKYSQVAELLTLALGDTGERVLAAAHSVLLPSLSVWSLEIGKLHTDLLHSFIVKLNKIVSASGGSGQSSSAALDKHSFCLVVHTVEALIPVLFASVLNKAPFVSRLDTVIQPNTAAVSSRFPPSSSELLNLSVLMGSSERLAALMELYEDCVGEEWYHSWEELEWVSAEFIPALLNLLGMLDTTVTAVASSLCRLTCTLCRTFGRTYTMSKIKPRFQAVLQIPEEHIDRHVTTGQTTLTKCTVPVYAAGVLAAFGQEEEKQQLITFLQDMLCTLALCQAPLDSLKAAFSELCLDTDYHDPLVGVLWNAVVHTSAYIRGAAAQMFELLIKNVTEALLSAKVVPALVTLASDPEMSVRIATVPAFGTIVECATNRAMLDKVHMQFQFFMDDPTYRDHHAMQVELVRTLARIGPNTEPKFRDEFLLPRLALIAANNNRVTNQTRKRDVAMQLFEAYSAVSCCFVSQQLIQDAVLPGLRSLQQDLSQVAPNDHANVVASMIREFSDKLDPSKPVDRARAGSLEGQQVASPPSAATDDVKSKVFSRFRDVKDKAHVSKPNFSKLFSKK